MDDSLFSALADEAQRQGVVDRDVVRAYPKLTEGVDASDANAVRQAVEQIRDKSPALFREVRWQHMTDREFTENEAAFRASLAPAQGVEPNEFRDLDAALLAPEEESALRRHLSHRGSSYDRSILRNALARQRRHGLSGDAA